MFENGDKNGIANSSPLYDDCGGQPNRENKNIRTFAQSRSDVKFEPKFSANAIVFVNISFIRLDV